MNLKQKKYNVLLFGDSHLRENIYPLNYTYENIFFDCCWVSGATAQGAVNPTSKTNALNIFIDKIKKISLVDYDIVGTMLGEVDCGFVIWYRAKKYNISIDEQLSTTINNLFSFVTDYILKHKKNNEVVVLGSVLPTITDDSCGNVAHLRSTINVSQQDRTKLTLKYNNILKTKCSELGINYADITDETISDTGCVDKKFLSNDPANHHLCFDMVGSLWYNKILSILNE